MYTQLCVTLFDIGVLSSVVPQARRSALYSSPGGHLFRQLLDLLSFYCDFPLNDHTGEQLKEDEVVGQHYDKVSGDILYVTLFWGCSAVSFYCDFPLYNQTGEQLKKDEDVGQHYDKVGVCRCVTAIVTITLAIAAALACDE
jgi:hypothetical protein